MTEPCDLSAVEARRLIGKKQLSPVELMKSCLKRIDDVNPALNAVVARDDAASLREAELAEEAVMSGEPLDILHGLPVGVKDLQTTGGLATTFGSLIYKDNVPEVDEDSVANLRDAGGIIVGKTNTPEFGAGANTKNKVYGATGNPFDPEKTCGGSSGGSAVALATGMMPLATGSDYGGSLRTPATFCGIAGFRPSLGMVPKATGEASLTQFSVLGPMGRTIADLVLLFRAQLDVDRSDPYSSNDAIAFPGTLPEVDLSELSVATSADLGCAAVDNGIAQLFETRVGSFASHFAEVDQTAPDFTNVHETFEILRGVNFVAAHREHLENHRELLGPNVIDNTERGLAFSAGDVAWALSEQTKIMRRVREFFDQYDVLISPASSVSPFPHAQLAVSEINGEKMPTYMRWLALMYALTTGLCCAATIPCGVDEHGMPFGIQIAGPRGSDETVLAVAQALEEVLAANPETRRPIPDLAKLSV